MNFSEPKVGSPASSLVGVGGVCGAGGRPNPVQRGAKSLAKICTEFWSPKWSHVVFRYVYNGEGGDSTFGTEKCTENPAVFGTEICFTLETEKRHKPP